MSNWPLLSVLIWLPIIGGALILAIRDAQTARWASLGVAVLTFAASLSLLGGYNPGIDGLQFVETHAWIPAYKIGYNLGVDGIAVALILLTTLVSVLALIGAWSAIDKRVNQYVAAFLILEGVTVGIFAATDGMLFYVFFEATLIPMYIIIGAWGGDNRIYAAFKFFLYTLMGSLLTLIAFIYLWHASGGSFDILTWHQVKLGQTEQILIFVALLAAFAVKVPMWPVHTWLPDVHVEAPTGGSIVLAAIMLKLGAYGFLRFSLPITPDASHSLAGLMITLSLVAVIYIGLVAIIQEDMKKLVAYSSVAHMGFVTLGFFIFNTAGVEGAIVQMISHGFVSGAMFMCIGVLYDRMHSRRIADYGGVVNVMPRFATFFILFSMANSGLPATSGFVGEFMVIMGAVEHNFWIGLLAATALILGASYSLWMVKRVVLGDIANDHVRELTDINRREFVILGVMAIAVLYMGIYPKPFTDVMHVSVEALLQHVAVSKL